MDSSPSSSSGSSGAPESPNKARIAPIASRAAAPKASRARNTRADTTSEGGAASKAKARNAIFGLRDLENILLADIDDDFWLYNPLIPNKSLTFIYGKQGSGKSFLVLDMVLSYATGCPFIGAYKRSGLLQTRFTDKTDIVSEPCALYLTCEGTQSLDRRVKSWFAKRKLSSKVFPKNTVFFITAPLQLHSQMAQEALVDLMDTLPAKTGLLVIDTLAAYTAGLDENDVSKTTQLISFLSALAKHMTVVVVHHSRKIDSEMRGHTSLIASADCAIKVSRVKTVVNAGKVGEIISLECTKQKDAQPFPEVNLSLEEDPLYGSCALMLEHGPPRVSDFDSTLDLLRVIATPPGSTAPLQVDSSPMTTIEAAMRIHKSNEIITDVARKLLTLFRVGAIHLCNENQFKISDKGRILLRRHQLSRESSIRPSFDDSYDKIVKVATSVSMDVAQLEGASKVNLYRSATKPSS